MKELDVRPVGASNDSIVLINPDLGGVEDRQFRNLLRCDNHGNRVWLAELPDDSETYDTYVGFEILYPYVLANTWSCFRVKLDLATGKILSTEFTK